MNIQLILLYFGLWLLLGGVLMLAGRLLRSAPATGAAEDEASPPGTSPATEGSSAGLVGVTLVLSLLLLCWSVLPGSPDAVLLGAGMPLVVLFIVLLHLRHRHTPPGQELR